MNAPPRRPLRKTQADRAATVAAELAADIAAEEAQLGKVDVKTAVRESDPQSASMAKAIGADQNLIAALSHVLFAVASSWARRGLLAGVRARRRPSAKRRRSPHLNRPGADRP